MVYLEFAKGEFTMQDHVTSALDRFKAQLRGFREDDEARWKYEEKEVQRQSRILKETGATDEHFREELKKAGINVSALVKDSEYELERQKRAFEELRKIERPPLRRGQKARILLDQLIALPHAVDTLIYPPANEGWGDTEDCGLNLGLGEFNIKRDSTGDGWGIMAAAYPTHYCTLIFYFFPPRAGELTVEPHVDFQGDVAVNAHDHWYTSTHAELEIKLHFDLFQHYWDGEQTATIVDEHRHSSSAAYWVDDHRVMAKTLSVSANDVVWIKLTLSLHVVAHSSHAHVACDFRTGSDRRIRVEYIRIHMPGSPIRVLSA
jgi:hypothetical protein